MTESGLSVPTIRVAKRKVTRAAIPAAGLGTRFLPATKAVPKAMTTVVDCPLVAYAVNEAHASGIKVSAVVTPRGGDATEAYFRAAHEFEQAASSHDL